MTTDTTPETDGARDDPVQVAGRDEFDALVEDHDVVLVDFYADWCGPCQMLAPIIDDLAAETSALVAKVDVDANQQLAGAYGVQGVPTLLLFDDGEPVEQVVGVQPKEQLQALLAEYAE